MADLRKVITNKGYSIPKSLLTTEQTAKLVEDLTVCPKLNTKFATDAIREAATFKIYRESSARWYLPRQYGLEEFGPADANLIPEGQDLPAAAADFKGNPYPYQKDIVDSFLVAGANGLICVPCGRGKTFMALWTAARIGKRFLVVVDKEFLMNQWRGEMAALLPGLRVGILQGPKREVNPAEVDCTICMIQSIAGKEIPESLFATYGFAIFDECHHLGAQHFSKCLQKIQVPKMLGLSATPKREDGLTKVFFWCLGKPVYWEKQREADPTVVVKSVRISLPDDSDYNTVPTNWRGEPVMGKLLTNVLAAPKRTAEIVRWIRELCAESARKVLVLSERIGHLEEIEAALAAQDATISTAYYIGGMKEEKREAGAAAAKVLLASYAMASEAMNIKTLNAVILASPRKAVEQSTGRILRTRVSERIVAPVIVDIVDSHGMYLSMWRKRATYYKTCAYKIQIVSMGTDSEEESEGEEVPAADAEIRKPNEFGCLLED
jgi:superfamily II DNA or RNA helicase